MCCVVAEFVCANTIILAFRVRNLITVTGFFIYPTGALLSIKTINITNVQKCRALSTNKDIVVVS